MINVIILPLLLISTFAFADDSYQMKNAAGAWLTTNGTFGYPHLLVKPSLDRKTLTITNCVPWTIDGSGHCEKYNDFVGTGEYSIAADSILVIDSAGSPTPTYVIQVDPNNPDTLSRSWGQETISYSRIK